MEKDSLLLSLFNPSDSLASDIRCFKDSSGLLTEIYSFMDFRLGSVSTIELSVLGFVKELGQEIDNAIIEATVQLIDGTAGHFQGTYSINDGITGQYTIGIKKYDVNSDINGNVTIIPE